MKIVGIVGVLDFPRSEDRVWRQLRIAFSREFPGADFVIEHCLYLPWQGVRMRQFADAVLKKYDTEEEILLVGYSLGGVIACVIAPKFKKSMVRAVVTIDAPHKLSFLYRLLRGGAHPLPMPVFTFAGILDPIVPWFLTRYPGNVHTNLFGDHFISYFFGKKLAFTIAGKVRTALVS